MNLRWFLALTLGCIVCLEWWTLCEAAGKKGRSSSGLAESRGRRPTGRGRKLKLHDRNEEELHGKRNYRQTSSSGRSKNQSSRRKKCACPRCEKCPVCPICKEFQPVDTDSKQRSRITTEKSPIAAITLDQTTEATSTTQSTTTTTTTPATTTSRTTRRTTTKSPLGMLLQTFGSLGNGFGSSSRNQERPTGGGFLGGVSFPNPFKNIIKIFSRISDLKRKMQKGVPNPFGIKTTKAATKCSKKSSNGNSDSKPKTDAIVVAIAERDAAKSDGKQVACSKVIELKHPGKIYICMEWGSFFFEDKF